MSKSAAAPKPPAYLSKSARDWFGIVVRDYSLDEHHRRLLLLACESWDRGQQAREAMAEHGTTYIDRFGSPKPRPEVAIERDSRIAFARLVRELDLDVEPPSEGRSRPPALPSNRRS